jgi:hypothetical protein
VVNTTVVNSGTFLGAVCFLAGSYLLLPARDGARGGPPAAGDDGPVPVGGR